MGEVTGGREPVFGSVDLDAVLDAWPECARVLSLSGEILHVNPAGLAMVEVMGALTTRLEQQQGGRLVERFVNSLQVISVFAPLRWLP